MTAKSFSKKHALLPLAVLVLVFLLVIGFIWSEGPPFGYFVDKSFESLEEESIKPTPQEDPFLSLSPDALLRANDSEESRLRREAVEKEYPELRDFENQVSTAGTSVSAISKGKDFYLAYIWHGSGVPIISAQCFRVDGTLRVYKVGEYPDLTDSYAPVVFKLDPTTCRAE